MYVITTICPSSANVYKFGHQIISTTLAHLTDRVYLNTNFPDRVFKVRFGDLLAVDFHPSSCERKSHINYSKPRQTLVQFTTIYEAPLYLATRNSLVN